MEPTVKPKPPGGSTEVPLSHPGAGTVTPSTGQPEFGVSAGIVHVTKTSSEEGLPTGTLAAAPEWTHPFIRKWHIRIDYASVAHPRANGQVERANGAILQGLKPRLKHELRGFAGRWVAELPSVL
ncbi:hypothetical protein ACQ4PT_033895 [Festuca glaucescens]